MSRCRHCGHEYIEGNNVKYQRANCCTKNCVCVTCKKTFTATHKRKYCIKECDPNYRPLLNLPKRTCIKCNVEYQPRYKAQKYCSSACHQYKPYESPGYYQSKEWKQLRSAFISSYTVVNGLPISNRFCIECFVKHNRLNDMYAVDHKIRVKDGGAHTFDNLQSLCKHHHQSKSACEGE